MDSKEFKDKVKQLINLFSIDDQGDFFTADEASREVAELMAELTKNEKKNA